jgi:hypothetical protein
LIRRLRRRHFSFALDIGDAPLEGLDFLICHLGFSKGGAVLRTSVGSSRNASAARLTANDKSSLSCLKSTICAGLNDFIGRLNFAGPVEPCDRARFSRAPSPRGSGRRYRAEGRRSWCLWRRNRLYGRWRGSRHRRSLSMIHRAVKAIKDPSRKDDHRDDEHDSGCSTASRPLHCAA